MTKEAEVLFVLCSSPLDKEWPIFVAVASTSQRKMGYLLVPSSIIYRVQNFAELKNMPIVLFLL
jgi:hypothetical protein